MNIKKEYIEKVLEYLKNFSKNRNIRECLIEEIKLLKEHINAYSSIDYTLVRSGNYAGIENLVITEETQICMKETQINIIDKEEKFLNLYLSKLDKEEKQIIELRYLNRFNNIEIYENIARVMNMSESTVRRKHKSAISNIAFYKFGSESLKS